MQALIPDDPNVGAVQGRSEIRKNHREIREIREANQRSKVNGIEVAIKEKFYRPHAQFHRTAGFVVRNMNLVVKTAGDPMALIASIRAEVRALDPNMPIANIRPMTDVVASAMARPRLAGWVLTLFGILALALAAVGL